MRPNGARKPTARLQPTNNHAKRQSKRREALVKAGRRKYAQEWRNAFSHVVYGYVETGPDQHQPTDDARQRHVAAKRFCVFCCRQLLRRVARHNTRNVILRSSGDTAPASLQRAVECYGRKRAVGKTGSVQASRTETGHRAEIA